MIGYSAGRLPRVAVTQRSTGAAVVSPRYVRKRVRAPSSSRRHRTECRRDGLASVGAPVKGRAFGLLRPSARVPLRGRHPHPAGRRVAPERQPDAARRVLGDGPAVVRLASAAGSCATSNRTFADAPSRVVGRSRTVAHGAAACDRNPRDRAHARADVLGVD